MLKFIRLYALIMPLLLTGLLVQAQTFEPDSIDIAPDSIDVQLAIDSLSLTTDSIDVSTVIDSSAYTSPIEDIVYYPAKDSTVYDIASQTVHLYSDAQVTYGDISLKAAYIKYDFKGMEVLAYGRSDSTGAVTGRPIFKQGDQEFSSDTVRYNFDSGQGLIKQVVTNDGESYVHAVKSKRLDNGQIHNAGGMYTTCSKENPHYHFRFNKMVVIPDDKIVTGPIYMKIRKVPLPLGLPFGYFPNSTKQKAGIIIPGYGANPTLGVFLINGGYYIPISERLDTKFTGDIYSRGSWGLRNVTRYFNRYRYSGNVDLSFINRLNGDRKLDDFSKTTSFFVRWSHTQDGKARPGTSFSANVNAGSSNNFRNNYNSSQNDFLSSTFSSNVNYSKRWNASQLTLSARHSQNTQSRAVTVTLPQIGFNLNRFFLPLSFIRGEAATTGGKRWFETIGVDYNSTFENRINTTEDQIRFDNQGPLSRSFVNGVRHNLNASTSIKAGFVSINPSFRMTERWHFSRLENKIVSADGLRDKFQSDTLSGFYATRNYSTGFNMTSKVYGMYNFKGNGLKAIRHVMTPSLGFTYSPEFDNRQQYSNATGEAIDYNPYTTSAYTESGVIGERGSVTFSMLHNLEGKIRTRSDSSASSTRKIKIIENATIRGSYNLMADSLNLSDLNVSARTTLYKGINIQYSTLLDPYQADAEGNSIDRFRINGRGPVVRADFHRISLNASLSGGDGKRKKSGKGASEYDEAQSEEVTTYADTEERERQDQDLDHYVDFNLPWRVNFTYTINQNNSLRIDEPTLQHNIIGNGDIRVFKYWMIGVNAGYDLVKGAFSNASIDLNWDLHCWEFNIGVIPIGERQSYNAFIGVKAAILQDLKYQRRGNLGGQDLLN